MTLGHTDLPRDIVIDIFMCVPAEVFILINPEYIAHIGTSQSKWKRVALKRHTATISLNIHRGDSRPQVQ